MRPAIGHGPGSTWTRTREGGMSSRAATLSRSTKGSLDAQVMCISRSSRRATTLCDEEPRDSWNPVW